MDHAWRDDVVIREGGGLVAFAESGFRPPVQGGHEPANFGFLPYITSSTAGLGSIPGSYESGVTLTPFGLALGLENADVNGNFFHCY